VVSFVKALSWRIWGTLISYIVAFWVTGDLTLSVSIGSLEALVKIFIYYLHERLWQFKASQNFATKINKLVSRK
jgi:uncharacterized membrane protein